MPPTTPWSLPRLTTPKGRKDDPDVAALKQVWESCKEGWKKLGEPLAVSGEEAMEDLRAVAPAMVALLDLTERFAQRYRQEKLRMNAAEFFRPGNTWPWGCWWDPTGPPRSWDGRWRAGTWRSWWTSIRTPTRCKNAIFQAVSREGKNLFTVGDVKQSIYRFRLADPTIFLDKYSRYKFRGEAAEGEPRKLLLSKNFRSRQEVLDGANFVFSNIISTQMGEMEYGDDEALHFGAEYYPEAEGCETEFHLIAARPKGRRRSGPCANSPPRPASWRSVFAGCWMSPSRSPGRTASAVPAGPRMW